MFSVSHRKLSPECICRVACLMLRKHDWSSYCFHWNAFVRISALCWLTSGDSIFDLFYFAVESMVDRQYGKTCWMRWSSSVNWLALFGWLATSFGIELKKSNRIIHQQSNIHQIEMTAFTIINCFGNRMLFEKKKNGKNKKIFFRILAAKTHSGQ